MNNKIEISAIEYFKTKSRMTKKCVINCQECPLSNLNNGTNFGCAQLEANNPKKAIEIVYNWNKEHPEKTIMQDFFEKFPNAPRGKNGVPICCPNHCGYTDENEGCSEHDNCFECWNRPIE